MITIYFLFILNIILLYIKPSQFKYILFLISILYLSLYLINFNYSVDHINYLRFWDLVSETSLSNISFNGEFIYAFLNKILSYITKSFAILPITILFISIASFYILLNTNYKSAPVLLSTLSFPLIGYLAFHNYRQSIACSFILVILSLIINKNKYQYKFQVFF